MSGISPVRAMGSSPLPAVLCPVIWTRLHEAAEATGDPAQGGGGQAVDTMATPVFVRHGGRHDISSVSGFRFAVPRRADIAEPTDRRIIKEVEDL